MKIKTLITGILLLFVGISAVYLVKGESRPDRTADESPTQPAIEPVRDAGIVDNRSEKSEEPNQLVIAYYFHGTQRCVTCRTIESFAEESLSTEFSGELEAGKLAWRPVNVDTPENEHFIQDYELSSRSVVLVKLLDGEQKQWKSLSRVWELVRDKPSFVAYVQEETREFLGE
jgi:hypothetical protein